jgi:hypothetical protein
MTFEVPMQTFQVREKVEKTPEVSYLSNTDPSSEE